MDEILKWLNRSKKNNNNKKFPSCSCRIFSPFYLHVLSSTYTEICTSKLQGSPWKTLCWQLRFLKPNKEEKLEWQGRDAKPLGRRKHLFGRGRYFCVCASAAGTQAAQPWTQPQTNCGSSENAASISSSFRGVMRGDAVNEHGGRFFSFHLSSRDCPVSSSPRSYHSLVRTFTCKFIMPVPHSFFAVVLFQ